MKSEKQPVDRSNPDSSRNILNQQFHNQGSTNKVPKAEYVRKPDGSWEPVSEEKNTKQPSNLDTEYVRGKDGNWYEVQKNNRFINYDKPIEE